MTDPPFNINEWTVTMNRWMDQGHIAHLRRGDGSPACGCKYHCAGGPFEGIEMYPKCRTCERIWRSRWKKLNP